jgi:hypothetical protein
MDPFVVIMVGLVAGLLVALLLIGYFYPGSGAEQLDWRPTRSVEQEVQNELDDLDQMLEAANERRRRRGAAELTEESIRATVAEDERDRAALRDRYLDEQQDVSELIELKNRRRRAKGLPEISEDEYRAQLEREGGGSAGGAGA